MGKLLLAFTVIPLVELYLLINLGTWMGVWPTIALVLVTGCVGAFLAKREGLKVLTQWRGALAEGRVPEEGVLGGVLVLVGGVLLVTPGVLTDALGLSLLVPVSRRFWATIVRRRYEKAVEAGRFQVTTFADIPRGPHPSGPVIDVPGEVVSEER